MRVHHERVCALHPRLRPAQLGTDPRRAGIRGVDVQPDAYRLARIRKGRHRIDGSRGRRADGGDQGGRIGEIECGGVQAELVVQRHLARLEAEQPRSSFDRRVGLLGADNDLAAVRPSRGRERGDRGDGRRVLDMAVPPGRKAEELRGPVERVSLQLG